MSERPTMDSYDPLSPAVQADPFPHYRRFHRTCPVHHHRLTDEQLRRSAFDGNPMIAGLTSEVYLLFGHHDVRAALQDHETFSSAEGVGLERTIPPNKIGMLLYADPPHHGPQRAIVTKALSPRLVKHMESRIAEFADDLIDQFIDLGEVDIATAYCEPLPGLMFCELLGVPPADQPMFKRWANATVEAFGGDAETQQRSAVAMFEMVQHFMDMIATRRETAANGDTLPEDLLTGLMTTEIEGRYFDDFEIVLALQILIAGGNDTSAGALGTGLHLLFTHPGQLALLRKEPALLPAAVEEILRFDAPAPCLFRNTTREVSVAGVMIPKGAKVGVTFSAANRDPDAFAHPDLFDITRPASEVRRHLAFGLGTHYCAGASLGRAQVRIGLERLFARLPNLRLDDSRAPVRRDALIARRFAHLHLRWDPPRLRPARSVRRCR